MEMLAGVGFRTDMHTLMNFLSVSDLMNNENLHKVLYLTVNIGNFLNSVRTGKRSYSKQNIN